jgi:Predicted integral membrane protein
MKRAPLWDISWLFLLTRILLILVTYFGYILLTQEKYSGTAVSVQTFVDTWQQWDAKIYVQIARDGYQSPYYTLAFFPLFPLFITFFAHLLGHNSYFLVGMLISNVALLGALFLLYQLAAEAGGERVARRTILYLCIFPTAFFFFTAYNESLFLLLTLSVFLSLRRQCWWLAGLCGLLAALTRNTGIMLCAPFLYELWLARDSIIATKRSLYASILPILLIPLGTLLYCLYNWHVSGNPLTFALVQSHWSRQLSAPWQAFVQTFFELFMHQPFGSFNQVQILIDTIATVTFIVLVILGRHQLRVSFTIWAALLLLSFLLSPSIGQRDALISSRRFVLEIFPAFITLAMIGIKHPRLHQTLLWIFPILLATLSLLFVMGKWMV